MIPTSPGTPFPGPSTFRVRVVGVQHAYGIVAAECVQEGSLLFLVDGLIAHHPSRYSVQIDADVHVSPAPDASFEELVVRYPWRFMNHSCEPNAVFRAGTFVALCSIEVGEAVTFDYNTTELDIAEPFDCRCSRDRCRGRVSGFACLPLDEQVRLRPWLAEHLRRRLDSAIQ